MKKSHISVVIILFLVLLLTVGVSACSTGEKDILVIAREDGSGTRDAFDGLIKNNQGDSLAKDKDGQRYPFSPLVKTTEILSKTGMVITKVASTQTAIGYISLNSLSDMVKALSISGVSANSQSVLDGSYPLKRPFVITYSNSVELTEVALDFLEYLGSQNAQKVVVSSGYVTQPSQTTYKAPQTVIEGVIRIKGSTSVDPLMDELIADYLSIGGGKVKGVVFEKDAQGSSYGTSAVKSDKSGNVIGMTSSSIKAADQDKLNYFNIALDAVVIIVNKQNTIDNLSVSQLFDIFTGAITKYSQIK